MSAHRQIPTGTIPAWVDGELRPVDKLAAHLDGLRHKAVSVFLFDGPRVLLQQRAAGKYHTPLLWANTCCTHPHWGEDPGTCAQRRLAEELGLHGLRPTHRGQVEYRADVGGGMVEHEVVEIFAADVGPVQPVPNPDEVADTAWMTLDALAADLAARPGRYTPWLRIYMAEHRALLDPATA